MLITFVCVFFIIKKKTMKKYQVTLNRFYCLDLFESSFINENYDFCFLEFSRSKKTHTLNLIHQMQFVSYDTVLYNTDQYI